MHYGLGENGECINVLEVVADCCVQWRVANFEPV